MTRPDNAKAQSWQANITNDSNFFNIQKAFYSDPEHVRTSESTVEDGPDELYKRWEHFMLPRVYPSGKPIAPDIIYKEWAKYQASRPMNKTAAAAPGPWHYIGPVVAPGNAGGTGRINCVTFNPGNPQIMWAGTASGGLWKSTDGGGTWTTNTDNLPDLGVTEVVINPRNTDTMFMATGDGFGYKINDGMRFGGAYSNGVMRSVDGGNTWDTTGLDWTQTQARQITHLVMSPENPNIILASTNAGIFRTTDGGNTWKEVSAINVSDLKMNETNHAIIYAGGSGFLMSRDTGATWKFVNISFTINPGAMSIASTPANGAVVYILLYTGYENQGSTAYLMRSDDSGSTWKSASTINATPFYGYYTAALRVNPKNADEVVVGGVNLLRSSNGGGSWNEISYDNSFPNSDYVHPDHRVFVYYPGSTDTIFNGNDGGLYKSTNGGVSWKLISNNIHALELYRIGSSASDSTLLYTGAQDNGVNEMDGTKWNKVINGDGMTCQVNPYDPNIAYGSWQYGNVQRTDNYGSGWSGIYPPSYNTVNWTAPFVLDPYLDQTIYFGGNHLYRSDDNGFNWTNISSGIKNQQIMSAIAIAPDDNQIIFAVLGSDQASPGEPIMWKTTNGGKTWTNTVKGPLTSVVSYQTGIDIDRRNPANVVTCFSGYNAADKVFISKDTGATWTNISNGLPNLPVNCIAFENSNENGIFAGTDVGVFYMNDNSNGWIPYNTGLPNVMVDQLEVFPAYNKIRAATYGRGVWDGTLYGTISGIEKMSNLQVDIKVFPNPSNSGIFTIQLPTSGYNHPQIAVYNMMGQTVASKQISNTADNTIAVDLSSVSDGIYIVNFNYPDGLVTKKVQVLR